MAELRHKWKTLQARCGKDLGHQLSLLDFWPIKMPAHFCFFRGLPRGPRAVPNVVCHAIWRPQGPKAAA